MTLTLDLNPEILARLVQGATAIGLSIEDYTLQVLTDSVPEIKRSQGLSTIDRQIWIREMQDFRNSIVTSGPALSQTIIDARDGERY
jgi:hypothetical protein